MGKVLHASNSGYFPFCISELGDEEIGPGTYYPLGMSLEKVMEIYWRIRDVVCNGPGDPEFTADIQYYKKGTELLFDAQEESDLVCTDGFFVNAIGSNDGQILHFVKRISAFGSGPSIIFSEGEYYPFIYFSALATVVGDDLYIGDSLADDFEGPTSSFTFFGLTIILYNSQPLDAEPYVGSMLAESYWSYGGTWDTTTGARL